MRIQSSILRLALLALALLLPAGAARAQGDAGYRVVVNERNAVTQMNRDELSRLFLKKTTTWSNGQTVAVIDRVESAEVRQQFTTDVHQRQVRAVKRYWQQMIFG